MRRCAAGSVCQIILLGQSECKYAHSKSSNVRQVCGYFRKIMIKTFLESQWWWELHPTAWRLVQNPHGHFNRRGLTQLFCRIQLLVCWQWPGWLVWCVVVSQTSQPPSARFRSGHVGSLSDWRAQSDTSDEVDIQTESNLDWTKHTSWVYPQNSELHVFAAILFQSRPWGNFSRICTWLKASQQLLDSLKKRGTSCFSHSQALQI